MTSNQIKRQQLAEEQRHNRVTESETKRSNVAKETEAKKRRRADTAIGAINAASGAAKAISSLNDPQWYNYNPQVTKDVANVAIQPLGASNKRVGSFVRTLPGICTIDVVLGPGSTYQDAISAPVNIAARNIYSYVRHMNSGASNYEAPDLMMYLLCVGEAYAMHAELRRVYGLMRNVDATNKYVGMNLVKALGYDYNDFAGNMADVRAYINMYGLRLSALKIPAQMDYFKKLYSMFSNVFKDGESSYEQLYAYRPYGFHTPSESSFYADLKMERYNGRYVAGTKVGWADTRKYAEKLLTNLLVSEDINIMSGDVNKAFGSEVFTAPIVDEGYSVEPIYDELSLAQFANTPFWYQDGNSAFNSLNVVQNDGTITYGVLLSATGDSRTLGRFHGADQMVRMFGVENTPENVMEIMAHGMAVEDLGNSDTGAIYLAAGGLCIALNGNIWSIEDTTGELSSISFKDISARVLTPEEVGVAQMAYFNYCPQVVVLSNNDSFSYVTLAPSSRQAMVDINNIKAMTQAAMLSLFHVPFN
uniref:Capsid protein n=1 Tax=Dromedary picobirnavirus TaxID=1574421 RepID=A0A0A1EJB1_9VIRU|nr:capsid protein [Dromedary picobirnavirus]